MDHGGEAARPTTVVVVVTSTEHGTAGAVQGGEAHVHTGGTFDSRLLHRDTFNGQLGAPTAAPAYRHVHVRTAAGRDEVPVAVLSRKPGPGVVHANVVGGFWRRQPGPGDEVLLLVAGRLQLPDPEGVVPVHDSYGYNSNQLLQQPRPPGAGSDEAHLLPDGGVGAGYDCTVGEYLRRLRAFIGIGACSVAVNGLAAGPGSPATAFRLFALLLGGLFLVVLHVIRV